MTFSLKLPQNYRSQEVFAFHGRDPEGLAERVEPDRIRKGFVMNGIALVLDISLRPGLAGCRVNADGSLATVSGEKLRRIARNLLALSIRPEPFEMSVKTDSLLGPLVQKQRGLRIPQTATPFEALTWAIIGQQINLPFAIALRRTLIRLAGQQHSSGLWCYPDAAAVARLNAEELGRQKFSKAKAEALVRLARMVDSGELPIDTWEQRSVEEIAASLLVLKGIGPWTVNYALLRGFGCEDCSLHGDAAIRNALRRLQGNGANGTDETKPSIADAQLFLERYKPHRSLAAAHLWASLNFSAS
ncbi:MAG TPA: hypothetical protein VIT91_16110 [Chthoniobacterales bacterium]